MCRSRTSPKSLIDTTRNICLWRVGVTTPPLHGDVDCLVGAKFVLKIKRCYLIGVDVVILVDKVTVGLLLISLWVNAPRREYKKGLVKRDIVRFFAAESVVSLDS